MVVLGAPGAYQWDGINKQLALLICSIVVNCMYLLRSNAVC